MKRMKKFAVIVSVVLILSLTALNSAALSLIMYKFDTWNGTGTVSAEVDCLDSEFDRLTFGSTYSDEIDSANYTVEKQQDKVIITLKEEYLKSLGTTDGTHTIFSHFLYGNCEADNQPLTIDREQNKLCMDLMPCQTASGFDLASFKLFYGDSEIDPSHYTMETGEYNGVITFGEGFLETLPEGQYFKGHSVYNNYTCYNFMELEVALEQTNETEAAEETESTEEPGSTEKAETAEETETEKAQDENPKTDSDMKTVLLPVVIVVTVFAVCIILFGIYKKRRKD